MAWSDPDSRFIIPVPDPELFGLVRSGSRLIIPVQDPELFGLVESGFWIHHPGSGSVAGSNIFYVLIFAVHKIFYKQPNSSSTT